MSHRLRGEGGGEATKGGAAFPSPVRAVGLFSFARQGGCTVFYILAAKPPTTTL